MLNKILHGALALSNVSTSDDTLLLRSLLSTPQRGSSRVYYCNNAGTVARFLMPLLAFGILPQPAAGTLPVQSLTLTGDDRLCQRPMAALIDALRSIGANITYMGNEGYLPVEIQPCTPNRKMISVDCSLSSQFASALLIAGAALPTGLSVSLVGHIASRPYIDMTVSVLNSAGIDVNITPNKHNLSVVPSSSVANKSIAIENDWSAASYFYCVAALCPGMRLRFRNLALQSLQGDSVCADIFAQLGVVSQHVRSPFRQQSKTITIERSAEPSAKLRQTFTHCPDLLPAVAVACAALGVDATLRGLKNLRHKESDRVEAVAQELRRMGVDVATTDDVMRLRPSQIHITQPIQTHGDHRIAMAFATLRVLYPEAQIEHPEVVSKSFPGFWDELDKVLVQQPHATTQQP